MACPWGNWQTQCRASSGSNMRSLSGLWDLCILWHGSTHVYTTPQSRQLFLEPCIAGSTTFRGTVQCSRSTETHSGVFSPVEKRFVGVRSAMSEEDKADLSRLTGTARQRIAQAAGCTVAQVSQPRLDDAY